MYNGAFFKEERNYIRRDEDFVVIAGALLIFIDTEMKEA